MIKYLFAIDNFFWSYIGIYIVLISGVYFTIRSNFYQLKILANFKKNISQIFINKTDINQARGISPLRLYFASVGGMIGLGNVVAVTSALLIGGPGALLWLWVAAIFGTLIKYCEIYLGVRYRVQNNNGSYHGGSIYYLQHAFKTKYVSILAAILLAIYGVEIYQFTVVSQSLTKIISHIYPVEQYIVVILLLILVIYSSFGGIKRLANICSTVMPVFIIFYFIVCMIIVLANIKILPASLLLVLKSAFTGHAALGGFAGSTIIMAAQQGIARAVYSGDIGIGYDSIIQSETQLTNPALQAKMAIFASLTDVLICTMSILVSLLTGSWHQIGATASECVANALAGYFPYMDVFMASLFFVAGYTTIIAYLAVGAKCASFLNSKYGSKLYLLYATIAFIFFSSFHESILLLIMGLISGPLVVINIMGIIKLRKEIKFE